MTPLGRLGVSSAFTKQLFCLSTVYLNKICTIQTNQSSIVRRMGNLARDGAPSMDGPVPKGAYKPRYIDIGVNLADDVYRGVYHGKKCHEDDFDDVIQRALDVGCTKMMVTGSDLESSRRAIKLADIYRDHLYATVGVHPCSTKHIEEYPGGAQAYMEELENLVAEGKEKGVVTAFGEIGLDYDRLMLSPKDTQLKYFEIQLNIARRLNLPLFLHSRAAATDFERLLLPHLPHLPGGLVHSFTGTSEELHRLLDAGLYIGINGCSLKTEENLAVVKEVPLDRLMLETDGPWCEVRRSHAGSKYLDEEGAPEGGVQGRGGKPKKKEKWEIGCRVTGRNEPEKIEQVAWIVARAKGVSLETVCEAAWKNSIRVFGLDGSTGN